MPYYDVIDYVDYLKLYYTIPGYNLLFNILL